MKMIRRTLPATMSELGPRQVRVRASTGGDALGRDRMIVVPAGIELGPYRRNPVMLWQHDPTAPVARAAGLQMDGEDLCADVEFAPAGVSAKADEICGLVKSGVINAVSIGFDPLESEPIDPKRGRAGGQRVLRAELMEISFVSVPADREAIVLQRKDGDKPQGDYGDVHYADPGYQSDGKPRYPLDTEKHIKAAWSYIHQEDDRKPYTAEQLKHIEAEIVAAWKEKIDKDGPPSAEDGKGGKDGGDRAGEPARRRNVQETTDAAPMLRGMALVGQLAWLMDCLCGAKCSAEMGSALEGDESQVPAMLASVLQNLGAALVAMTAEEVAELCEGSEADPADEIEDMNENGVAMVMAAKTPLLRQFRIGQMRGGKAISNANARYLAQASDHHDRALDYHRAAERCRSAMGGHRRELETARGRMADQHAQLGNAIEAVRTAPADKMPAALENAARAHASIGRAIEKMADHHDGMLDEHEEMEDAHRGIARSVRAAQRAVRSVGDGMQADMDKNRIIQTSAGIGEDEGSRSADFDFRLRQVERLRLASPPV